MSLPVPGFRGGVGNDSRGQGQGQDKGQIQLRWKSHLPSIFNIFQTLYNSELMVDVTLAAEGKYLRAHKIILCACSPYFQELLSSIDCSSKHPILFMSPGIKFKELKCILDYMYKGETHINREDLPPLLQLAKTLQIRGLAKIPDESSGQGQGQGQGQGRQNSQQQSQPHSQQQIEEVDPLELPSPSPSLKLKRPMTETATATFPPGPPSNSSASADSSTVKRIRKDADPVLTSLLSSPSSSSPLLPPLPQRQEIVATRIHPPPPPSVSLPVHTFPLPYVQETTQIHPNGSEIQSEGQGQGRDQGHGQGQGQSLNQREPPEPESSTEFAAALNPVEVKIEDGFGRPDDLCLDVLYHNESNSSYLGGDGDKTSIDDEFEAQDEEEMENFSDQNSLNFPPTLSSSSLPLPGTSSAYATEADRTNLESEVNRSQGDHLGQSESEVNVKRKRRTATTTAKKKRSFITWTKVESATFSSAENAIAFIENQKLFLIRRKAPSKLGERIFYDCRYRRTLECESKLSLLLKNDQGDGEGSQVELYTNSEDHNHEICGCDPPDPGDPGDVTQEPKKPNP